MTQLITPPRPAVRPAPSPPRATSNGAGAEPKPVRETLNADLEALAGSSVSPRWLARLSGLDSLTVQRMCDEGALLSIRPDGAREPLIPIWQVGDDGKPLATVPLVLAEAERAGLDPLALHKLMSRRAGLTGGDQLGDLLRAGRHDHVLSVIRSDGLSQPRGHGSRP